MAIIHMKTEYVESLARQMDFSIQKMYDSWASMKSSINTADVHWDGGSSYTIISSMRTHANAIQQQLGNLQKMVSALYAEQQQWMAADQDGVGTFQRGGSWFSLFQETGIDTTISLGPYVIGAGMSTASGFLFSDNNMEFWQDTSGELSFAKTQGEYDWDNWSWNRGKEGFDHFNEIAKHIPYEGYKDIGRQLNHLVGNQKAGYVGMMDDVGHVIKSPVVQNVGIPFVTDFADGMIEGEGWQLAGLSAAGSTAIMGAAAWLIPGVGQAMLISGGIQLAGNLVAGGLSKLGLESEAAWLQDGLDVIDLGGYVEDISDAAANFVLHPENGFDTSALQDRIEFTAGGVNVEAHTTVAIGAGGSW